MIAIFISFKKPEKIGHAGKDMHSPVQLTMYSTTFCNCEGNKQNNKRKRIATFKKYKRQLDILGRACTVLFSSLPVLLSFGIVKVNKQSFNRRLITSCFNYFQKAERKLTKSGRACTV